MSDKENNPKKLEKLEEHEALVILTRVAEHLRTLHLPPTVKGQWAEKAAEVIERYLNTPHFNKKSELDAESLDAAFGLNNENQAINPGPKPHKNARKIVELIVENYEQLSKERTKHHNPAEIKDKIAEATGSSRKTIERYKEKIDQFYSDIEKLKKQNPILFGLIVAGISDNISSEI